MDDKGQRGTISDLVITCNCSIHFLFEKVNSKICLLPLKVNIKFSVISFSILSGGLQQILNLQVHGNQ